MAAVLGAVAWGNYQRGRADQATVRLEAALHAQRDSADRWAAHRDTLTLEIQALRGDSALLALRFQKASQSAQVARRNADSLLRLVPDTLQPGIRLAFDSLNGAVEACEAVAANCEARAANAEQRARGDSVQLMATVLLLQKTEVAWHTEQRKNDPGFLGLRSFWHARAYTIPLTAVVVLLLSRH